MHYGANYKTPDAEYGWTARLEDMRRSVAWELETLGTDYIDFALIHCIDEPTAGLDPKERVRFRNLIAGFARDKIVLLSTHIVSDVEHIADEILVMRAGAVVLSGPPAELVSEAEGRVWEATVAAERADALEGRLTTSNVRYLDGGHALVRYVVDVPEVAGSTPAAPMLEDLYLYVFRDEAPAARPQPARPPRRPPQGGPP